MQSHPKKDSTVKNSTVKVNQSWMKLDTKAVHFSSGMSHYFWISVENYANLFCFCNQNNKHIMLINRMLCTHLSKCSIEETSLKKWESPLVEKLKLQLKMWSARLPSVTVATTDNQTFHIGLWQLWLIMAFLIVLKRFVYFTRQESSTRMEHLRAQCSDGWELRPSRTGPRLLTVTHPCTRSPADRIVLIILVIFTILYSVIIFF